MTGAAVIVIQELAIEPRSWGSFGAKQLPQVFRRCVIGAPGSGNLSELCLDMVVRVWIGIVVRGKSGCLQVHGISQCSTAVSRRGIGRDKAGGKR
ncbi:hypothetical protein H9L39_05946 [Fusarium oxysporum f. sp. albedinis]|jgi:hypothetical protein|nr:hypothetical protein H9L39_05946 [Fusarium oxysporum f. sp. albedinis]